MTTPPRVLGFWAAVSIVMGNMIGSGVFLLPSSLAAYRGLSLIGWLVSAGGAVMLALVFARLARQFPAAGGPYAYTRQAFGDVPGFLVAWGYWLSVVGTLAALAVAFVGYLDPFIPGVVACTGRGGGTRRRAVCGSSSPSTWPASRWPARSRLRPRRSRSCRWRWSASAGCSRSTRRPSACQTRLPSRGPRRRRPSAARSSRS